MSHEETDLTEGMTDIEESVTVVGIAARVAIFVDREVYEWFEELTPQYKFLMGAVLKRYMKGCKKTLRELNSHNVHEIMDATNLD